MPALVRLLIERLLPEDQREFYLGDLEESGKRPWLREIAGAAALRLGSPARRRPTIRHRRFAALVHHIPSDLRLGIRRLLKTPAASTTIIVALSVGIGLCALMFSIINGAILPILPFENGERIVRVSPVSAETYLYWEERQQSFEALGIVSTRTVNLAVEGRATEPVNAAAMSLSTFSFLGVEPVIGRPFTDTDAAPGASAVALIGEDIWRRPILPFWGARSV